MKNIIACVIFSIVLITNHTLRINTILTIHFTIPIIIGYLVWPYKACDYVSIYVWHMKYSKDINGQTVLHYTAKSGNVKCLKFLLECGVNIHTKVSKL